MSQILKNTLTIIHINLFIFINDFLCCAGAYYDNELINKDNYQYTLYFNYRSDVSQALIKRTVYTAHENTLKGSGLKCVKQNLNQQEFTNEEDGMAEERQEFSGLNQILERGQPQQQAPPLSSQAISKHQYEQLVEQDPIDLLFSADKRNKGEGDRNMRFDAQFLLGQLAFRYKPDVYYFVQ
ncbi:hypothetical protein BDA99DRAFT_534397 [Phascolomyces articulosus]|uniref:Uncharacterized protein n=1 Tax=Phascolomyces articulosus TaxID=60185 RepID=A0AAD5KIU8_9FUNG|nr:hypothetical protein BDA99DRAFT_534397 [Phascolomyces articulosus]